MKRKSITTGGLFVLAVVLVAGAVFLAASPGGCRPEPSGGSPTAPAPQAGPQPAPSGKELTIVTWNVRGYPEKDAAARSWFTAELARLAPGVLCIQEIANAEKVQAFTQSETKYVKYAFLDSPDGQDNAVFTVADVELRDLPDPAGFQHPAQAAYVAFGGFDAVVVTVHLSWTNVTLREQEKALLKGVVQDALKTDPDVIVCGDFNTTEPGISELAQTIGLKVMTPEGQDGVGTTHAGNRYDHFLVSPDLAGEEAIRCRIVTYNDSDLTQAKVTSDHLPVMARFRADEAFKDRK